MTTYKEKIRIQLYKLCEETKTSKDGIDYLVNYYIHSLGWSEEKALEYAISLFKSGTIEKIKIIGKEGKEL